jgi:hypothetical protein
MDDFEVAVFTSQSAGGSTGGRLRRRRTPDLTYSWHLMHAERPLTLCGIEFSYAYSRRRLWNETPENQRCRSCLERQQRRVSRADTTQRTAGIAAGIESDFT